MRTLGTGRPPVSHLAFPWHAGLCHGRPLNSLASRGNSMKLLSNEVEETVSKEMEIDKASDGKVQLLDEAELCETYGYELALSPAGTVRSYDGDQCWISEDSVDSQTSVLNVSSENEEFDMLETYLFRSEHTFKRSGKEISWFSEDSSDSQSYDVKMCTEEFDLLETTLFSAREPSVPLVDISGNRDNQSLRVEEKSNVHRNSDHHLEQREPRVKKAGQHGSSENCIAERTVHLEALMKTMTLTQKKKFYAWFSTGLSIEEAALKSKKPDLNPPPVRHPDCKFSKRRLRRLSKILPNVFLQRQFVNESYFIGADPKRTMRYLLMGSGSENLVATFECQFALAEYAATKEKLLRKSMLDEAGAAVADDSAAVVQQRVPDSDFEAGANGTNSGSSPKSTNNLRLNCAEGVIDIKAVGTSPDAELPVEKFVDDYAQRPKKTKPSSSRKKRNPFKNDVQHKAEKVCDDKRSSSGVTEEAKNLLTSGGHSKPSHITLKQLAKYYKWRNLGFSHSEALVKAVTPGLVPESVSHPSCKHSLREVKDMSNVIPKKHKRDRFLIEVFYGGKRPEDVMKSMYPVADSVVREKSDGSISHCKSSDEPQLVQQDESDHMSSVDGHHQPVEENTTALSKTGCSRLNLKDTGTNLAAPSLQNQKGVEKVVSKEMDAVQPGFANTISKENDDSIFDTLSDPVLELSIKPLKIYYAWRNRGLSHDDALSKAHSRCVDLPGKALKKFYAAHRNCKYAKNELKQMSKVLPDGIRGRFLIHTFFGGVDPECAVKLLTREPRIPIQVYLANGGDNMAKKEKRFLCRLLIRYLMEKGLTRDKASKMLVNPSKNLSKELEEVIEVYYGESCPPAEKNPPNIAESKKIPFSSPYHPSKLLTNGQLKKYYLWIGSGCSREDAIKKVMNLEPLSRDLYRLHQLKSKWNLEEVRKMSKGLPNEALARTFVIETFYGQNDPEELMKILLPSANTANLDTCSESRQAVGQNLAADPKLSAEEVQDVLPNSIQSAELPLAPATAFVSALSSPTPTLQQQIYPYGSADIAGTPTTLPLPFQVHPALLTTAYSVHPPPAVRCLQHHAINTAHPNTTSHYDTVSISDSSYQAPPPKEEPPSAENSTLENEEVQCFIVPANFPNEILTEAQMDAIENSVLEAILEMDDDDTKPSFKGSSRNGGRYGIICNDEFSVDWLCKYLRVYEPWEGALLSLITDQSAKTRANAVLPVDQSAKTRANAVLPLCKDDDGKILKFIEKQNFGLNVGKWTVIQRWDSSDGSTFMDLVVDEESAEILRSCSRISFKLGSAEIIIAQKDSKLARESSSPKRAHSASPPPLPSSPPPSPPPPPPPSPKPCIIDTSLGALLKTSTSQSYQVTSQKDNPPQESRHCTDSKIPRPASPEDVCGKRHSRKGQLNPRERSRSRSSPQDHCGRAITRNSSPRRSRKRKRSKDERKRSASRSASRDRTHRNKRTKRRKKGRKRYNSRSPSKESGPKGSSRKEHSWLDWFYPGEEHPADGLRRNPKRAPPLSTTPCSFISSEENSSLWDSEPRQSSSCLKRAGSCENMEYAQYLGSSSTPKPSEVFVDLTDSP